MFFIENHGCATQSGYDAHVRRNDPPCTTCKEWMKKVKAGENAPVKNVKAAQCGTPSGYKKHRRNHEPACRECLDSLPKKKGKERQAVAQCGTPGGYARHLRETGKGTACEPCLAAMRAKDSKRGKRTRVKLGATPNAKLPAVKHGTTGGYDWHTRYGVPMCDDCREAKNAARRERRAERNRENGITPRAEKAACGTASGYDRHLRETGKGTACEPCKKAKREKGARLRAEAKALKEKEATNAPGLPPVPADYTKAA